MYISRYEGVCVSFISASIFIYWQRWRRIHGGTGGISTCKVMRWNVRINKNGDRSEESSRMRSMRCRKGFPACSSGVIEIVCETLQAKSGCSWDFQLVWRGQTNSASCLSIRDYKCLLEWSGTLTVKFLSCRAQIGWCSRCRCNGIRNKFVPVCEQAFKFHTMTSTYACKDNKLMLTI